MFVSASVRLGYAGVVLKMFQSPLIKKKKTKKDWKWKWKKAKKD